MRPMWHVIRGLKVRVPVLLPVSRRPLATPQVTSLGSTAFAAMIVESEDDAHRHQESSPQEEADSFGAGSSQEDDEELFIPSYLMILPCR